MYAKNVYKYDESKRREHMAVRTTVGWYLWTHQLIEVKGKDAAVFLDLIFANPIATLKVGRERYTTMLNEQAEIIDDVVVIRLEEEKFWISTLFAANMLTWLTQHKNSFCVEMEDVTKQYHMYAVQGPNSRALVNALVRDAIDELKFFSICDNWIEDVPVKINRAGFTGEKLGYEIYIPSNQCQFLENKLRQYGEPLHAVEITEFQSMAWTLPTEAGFYYMRDLMHTNPLEVGLERGIGWEKEFIGKEALLQIKEQGALREMVGFTMEESDVRINGKDLGGPGAPVYVDDEEIGRVSKFNYSYVQEKCVGYILAKKDAVKEGMHVKIKSYDAVITEKYFL